MLAVTVFGILTIINGTALQHKKIKLQEILSALKNVTQLCNRSEAVCSEIHVKDVITVHQKTTHHLDIFCKAAAALKKVKDVEEHLRLILSHLVERLTINGSEQHHGKNVICKRDEEVKPDVEVDLHTFLKDLRKVAQKQYWNLAALNHH
ncbi:hypothetical protein NDU88_005532 [Pleurodeles waltl]|uniref:Interleukin-4 n=1 Tax=Pleurodeles waltl TaxID=8319 RepID=A0AAV7PJU6_PLEWA|nr:hypothetical protein NDU88_005532 [Pleurodeles waltl]